MEDRLREKTKSNLLKNKTWTQREQAKTKMSSVAWTAVPCSWCPHHRGPVSAAANVAAGLGSCGQTQLDRCNVLPQIVLRLTDTSVRITRVCHDPPSIIQHFHLYPPGDALPNEAVHSKCVADCGITFTSWHIKNPSFCSSKSCFTRAHRIKSYREEIRSLITEATIEWPLTWLRHTFRACRDSRESVQCSMFAAQI